MPRAPITDELQSQILKLYSAANSKPDAGQLAQTI